MVSPEVVFHPEAAQEYVEALRWYGERGVQLREAFEQEVERPCVSSLHRLIAGLGMVTGTDGY